MTNDTPAEVARRYQPNPRTRPDVADLWPRIGHIAADLVIATDPPTNDHAKAWMTSVGQFLTWAIDNGLWVPESGQRIPLTLPVVDHYIGQRAAAGYGAPSTVRSQLKRVGRTYNPDAWPYTGTRRARQPRRPPYTPAEQRALWDIALRLWEERDEPAVATVMAAAFGAGIDTPDFRGARGTDLADTPAGLTFTVVAPGRARTVPVADAWADRVAETCAATGDNLIVGTDPSAKNMMGTTTYQMERYGPLRLNVARARTTWLVDRLAAQVPPVVLLRHAGLKSISPIERALTYVPDVPDDEADRLMRRDP